MIFLGYNKLAKEDVAIDLTHYFPDELPQEMLEQGLLVEEVPEPEQREGKYGVLMINPVTKELYYNYFDIPKTEADLQRERLQSLEEENAGLIFQNAIQDMRIDSVENENAELLFKIAMLEMGGM